MVYQLMKISFDSGKIRGGHRRVELGGQLLGRLKQLAEVGARHFVPKIYLFEILKRNKL
jgi:hypothetical protein